MPVSTRSTAQLAAHADARPEILRAPMPLQAAFGGGWTIGSGNPAQGLVAVRRNGSDPGGGWNAV